MGLDHGRHWIGPQESSLWPRMLCKCTHSRPTHVQYIPPPWLWSVLPLCVLWPRAWSPQLAVPLGWDFSTLWFWLRVGRPWQWLGFAWKIAWTRLHTDKSGIRASGNWGAQVFPIQGLSILSPTPGTPEIRRHRARSGMNAPGSILGIFCCPLSCSWHWAHPSRFSAWASTWTCTLLPTLTQPHSQSASWELRMCPLPFLGDFTKSKKEKNVPSTPRYSSERFSLLSSFVCSLLWLYWIPTGVMASGGGGGCSTTVWFSLSLWLC